MSLDLMKGKKRFQGFGSGVDSCLQQVLILVRGAPVCGHWQLVRLLVKEVSQRLMCVEQWVVKVILRRLKEGGGGGDCGGMLRSAQPGSPLPERQGWKKACCVKI
jgi:hypothetical protein